MLETGIVIEEKGSNIVVQMKRQEACAKCRACSLGSEEKNLYLEAENKCDAVVGDEVSVSLEQTKFLSAVLIMYTIPLIAMLGGIGAGYYLGDLLEIGPLELFSVVVGFIILALAYLIIRKNEDKFQQKQYRPQVVNVVKKRI
ncbi:RseC/MucC-like positive regulator of sigma(E) [Natranaerovirga hydrolytica]|uniref:RseC/MucC-like positive regulator of sigma(E) n=1 Tax=Natranaerovirga hydrolytica TaxID=680378 RepID=A0A4R1MX77_9FIRM|nr:SoxR reducing system RseC family protein [Natranaerovirga hydrolytica]TCK97806.1 RseC/MucC-like positive regulator of sigma(E) [Natranaerovirga hydrolytica]